MQKTQKTQKTMQKTMTMQKIMYGGDTEVAFAAPSALTAGEAVVLMLRTRSIRNVRTEALSSLPEGFSVTAEEPMDPDFEAAIEQDLLDSVCAQTGGYCGHHGCSAAHCLGGSFDLRRLLEAHLAQAQAEARRLYEAGWRLEYGWNELSAGGTQVHRLKSPSRAWVWCDGEEPPAELAALGEAAEWLAQF